MNRPITVGNKSDDELARETLLVKRLRVACMTIAKAGEELREKQPRERPAPLARLQREYFELELNRYATSEDPEAFVCEIERRAEEASVQAQNTQG